MFHWSVMVSSAGLESKEDAWVLCLCHMIYSIHFALFSSRFLSEKKNKESKIPNQTEAKSQDNNSIITICLHYYCFFILGNIKDKVYEVLCLVTGTKLILTDYKSYYVQCLNFHRLIWSVYSFWRDTGQCLSHCKFVFDLSNINIQHISVLYNIYKALKAEVFLWSIHWTHLLKISNWFWKKNQSQFTEILHKNVYFHCRSPGSFY